ncbi:MAG: tetratricopeptide repeat protein [Deltaproteobacteria bacterium]|nr:tetratricopeptide repeat protein [Deltaproteobacteria bacterium]
MSKVQLLTKMMCRSKEAACSRFLTVLVVLMLLAGCATGGKVVPETTVEIPQVPDGPTVTRFEDGRKGFTLSENANLDADTRRDFDLAVEFMENHEFDQAIELLIKVVGTSPGVTAPYINLALAYGKVGKPNLAEEHLQTALNLFPGHPVASNEYGLLLRKAGRFTEAKNIYEQALTIFPEYLPVRKNLGILCDFYLNDQKCALAQFQLYSELDPGNEQVKLWISELSLRSGQ